MPGSIRLSVLEWTETTPAGSISTLHSIKVSVGKNVYQSAGRENFSFPVTSIRDDLVIILCDSDGSLVTKKVLKTILVVEKGDAEIVFPLGSGGNLKLRLSFILSEEEKEKIREMRSSVLKRKHEELIKGNNDIVSSGTSLQLATKDASKLSNQKMPKISTESNRTKIEDHGPLHITKEKKKISFLTVSQSVDGLTESDNKRSAPMRTPSDNIKKMISAFESNDKQNLGSEISPRTRTRVYKNDSQTSIESMSYENEDIKQRRVSQTLIRRSFSAGNLTKAILQNDPNFAEMPHETLTSSSDERIGVNTENRETNLLPWSVARYQHKEGGLSNKVYDGDIFHGTNHRQVYGVSRYINELSCIDRTSYFFEISDMLIPHHLCLTSAPKKARHFLENITASSTHIKKIKLHATSSNKIQREIVSTCQTDESRRHKLRDGSYWYIELIQEMALIDNIVWYPIGAEYSLPICTNLGTQTEMQIFSNLGARIFIVIVACGTIIFNTR